MRSIKVVILLVSILLLAGCTESVEKQVQEAVVLYNQKLIQVYETGQLEPLNTVALEPEVRRVDLFLQSLNAEQRRMQTELEEFKVIDTQKATTKSKDGKNTFVYYQVKTKEIWKYTYLDAKSSAPVEGPKRVQYQVTYDVVQPTGKQNWVIYKVNFQEEQLKQ